MDPASDLILALDFGGTKHSAALLRPESPSRSRGQPAWLDLRRQPAPPGADRAVDLRIMFNLVRGMLRDHPGQLRAVGVSFGGPVDFERGRVRLSHHVPGWEDAPLQMLVQTEFGAPASVDNDANAGALGEHRFGAGRGCHSLLYMTVSTGIGGGWVLDGRVYRGADGMAGEIGHTRVDPAGPVCICGRRGCLEILACGPAIARRARECLAARPDAGAELRRLSADDPAHVTALLVSQAAAAGDVLAEQVLLEAARDLGLGIGNALSLMNPERVVLGGGVTKSGPAYWAQVRRAARGNTLPEIRAEIVPAALGDDAPLWGAVALASDLTDSARQGKS